MAYYIVNLTISELQHGKFVIVMAYKVLLCRNFNIFSTYISFFTDTFLTLFLLVTITVTLQSLIWLLILKKWLFLPVNFKSKLISSLFLLVDSVFPWHPAPHTDETQTHPTHISIFSAFPAQKTFHFSTFLLFDILHLSESNYCALLVFPLKQALVLTSCASPEQAVVSHLWQKEKDLWWKQNTKRERKKEKWTKREKVAETPFSANKLTFHQVLLHVPFTFIGLSPCSITKVLTGADYSNTSSAPEEGSPRGQECRRAFLRANSDPD